MDGRTDRERSLSDGEKNEEENRSELRAAGHDGPERDLTDLTFHSCCHCDQAWALSVSGRSEIEGNGLKGASLNTGDR